MGARSLWPCKGFLKNVSQPEEVGRLYGVKVTRECAYLMGFYRDPNPSAACSRRLAA